MVEYKNKNDYSVTVFNGSGFLAKYTFVNDIFKLVQFLNHHHDFHNWTAINVYLRRSGRFIKQYRRGDYIPPKPKF